VKLDALLLCEKVFLDDSKKPSVFGIFNEVRGRKLPFSHGPIGIFVRVSAVQAAEKVPFAIAFIDPNNKTVAKVEGNLNVPSQTIEFHFNLPGIPLKVAGIHKVVVYVQNKPIGDTGFVVKEVGSDIMAQKEPSNK